MSQFLEFYKDEDENYTLPPNPASSAPWIQMSLVLFNPILAQFHCDLFFQLSIISK